MPDEDNAFVPLSSGLTQIIRTCIYIVFRLLHPRDRLFFHGCDPDDGDQLLVIFERLKQGIAQVRADLEN